MLKPGKLLLLSLLLLGSTPALTADVSNRQQETTGSKKKHVVALLFGTVRDVNGAPVRGIRVDVFGDPQRNPQAPTQNSDTERPLASTETTPEGKFRFQKLPAGKYDVRFTATGFNELHLFVEVKPSSGRYKAIDVQLPAAA